jgi:UDP-N-acetylglucosamine 2-epimerase (non-hydrolysing)
MKEVFEYYASKIDTSAVLEKNGLKKNRYFLVSIHREENLDLKESFENLPVMLNTVAAEYKMPIIFSTHPRTMKKLEQLEANTLSENIKICKPFGFFDYVKLQKEAFCVLSDSGTIAEESSLLGINAVTLRLAHERPEGMDAGVLIMSDMDAKSVLDAIKVSVSIDKADVKNIPDDYNVDNVSSKVVKIIYSYTNYINRTVWKK